MSPLSPTFDLAIDGADAVTWVVSHVQGAERIGVPFRFTVVAQAIVAEGATVPDLDELVSQPAKLTWPTGDGTRTLHGVVDRIACGADVFEVVVVPRVALLADTADFRVFLDEDAIAIATTVLGDHGVTLDARVKTTPAPRPQSVQAFESDLAFVTRILAEEGIAWYVGEDENVIVATDHDGGYRTIDGGLPVVEPGAIVRGRAVHRARIDRQVTSSKVTVRDYEWKTPVVDLESSKGEGDLESYEFPGHFSTAAEGDARAALRLEEARARAKVLVGESTAREISAGSIITVEDGDAEIDGEWLVVETEHQVHAEADDRALGRDATVRFVATPKKTPFRPARTPAPRMNGVQTAVTTGPSGQEIHTEAHARVKTLLRWDRRGKPDDTSSAWTRTLQPPTSGGFMLPRMGWEVLLGFTGGSADAPIVLGRLANGAAVPPQSLPGDKTMTAFGSLTSPGGGKKNLVRMGDSAGSEGFDIVASYDLNERTENDKVTLVHGDETDDVGSKRTLIVGQVHSLTVIGSQTHSVGASRNLAVDANMTIKASAESITVGAMRIFKVGGDSTIGCATLSRLVGGSKVVSCIEQEARTVTGASSVMVGGSWNCVAGTQSSISVGGASSETVGGPKSVKTKQDYSLTVKGDLTQTFASHSAKCGKVADTYEASVSYDIGGSAKLKGADVIITATDKLTIKADGITVTVTSDEVKIDGKFSGSVDAVDDGDEAYA